MDQSGLLPHSHAPRTQPILRSEREGGCEFDQTSHYKTAFQRVEPQGTEGQMRRVPVSCDASVLLAGRVPRAEADPGQGPAQRGPWPILALPFQRSYAVASNSEVSNSSLWGFPALLRPQSLRNWPSLPLFLCCFSSSHPARLLIMCWGEINFPTLLHLQWVYTVSCLTSLPHILHIDRFCPPSPRNNVTLPRVVNNLCRVWTGAHSF